MKIHLLSQSRALETNKKALELRGFDCEAASAKGTAQAGSICLVDISDLDQLVTSYLVNSPISHFVVVGDPSSYPKSTTFLVTLLGLSHVLHAPSWDAAELAILRLLRKVELQTEIAELVNVASEQDLGLVGTSQAMHLLRSEISRAAGSHSSVLISGESGTGKELVAKALHNMGPNRDQPFVAINCSAIPDSLLESELFGHEKGAFTDAKSKRKGLFQLAEKGTIFLDEIGDMPLSMQPKLLRAIQERSFRPVGATQEVRFDARIVAATHVNLELAVSEKQFRQDLFYRINVISLDVPSLRERHGDVLQLADHFLRHFAELAGKEVYAFSNAALQELSSYPWPGNVRELQNCIERSIAMCTSHVIELEDLPPRFRLKNEGTIDNNTTPPGDVTQLLQLSEVERRYILQVFELLKGNKKRTAEVLGLDRKTLYRKLKKYNLI